MTWRPTIGFSVLTVMLAGPATWEAVEPARNASLRPRRPIAAVVLDDGAAVAVANRNSGTISIVDLEQVRVRSEVTVGARLADLVAGPDRKQLLAIDDVTHELIHLQLDNSRPIVRARLTVCSSPATVAVSADGRVATVAGLWSRCLDIIDLTKFRKRHSVQLPFAPRRQCHVSKDHVLVADGFAGQLALVDLAKGRIAVLSRIEGHNIRGLALNADGKELLVAHQMLDQRAPTTVENIRTGLLMTNVLRRIPLSRLNTPNAVFDDPQALVAFDGIGAGAGDPAGIAVAPGRIVVALAGVDEVALLDDATRAPKRIGVGKRPTCVVRVGERFVVLNTFDDSLSVVDSKRAEVNHQIALGAETKLSHAERGEVLFHDARLSFQGWMSCHSCHPDGHTTGLNADTFGDGSFDTPKRTLTLMGSRLTDPWGWNGSMKYLHDQIEKSLGETMHLSPVPAEAVNDLTSFVHSLPPPPALLPARDDADDRAQLERGRRVFEERSCVRCHIPPLTYSSHGTRDVGFRDEKGLSEFNPPALRGVGQGYRFLHDGRAATLDDVFSKHKHKVGDGLKAAELADLLRFLRSL